MEVLCFNENTYSHMTRERDPIKQEGKYVEGKCNLINYYDIHHCIRLRLIDIETVFNYIVLFNHE